MATTIGGSRRDRSCAVVDTHQFSQHGDGEHMIEAERLQAKARLCENQACGQQTRFAVRVSRHDAPSGCETARSW